MNLPAIDVQLMHEHLVTHEGILYKLRLYYHHVKHPTLKQIIQLQYMIMEDHVRVMLSLLDPSRTNWINLTPIDLNIVFSGFPQHEDHTSKQDKPISLEGRATAKFMANNNFLSALMMKDPNVVSIHHEMALQQAKFVETYARFIQSVWAEQPTMSSSVTQVTIIQEFEHLLK